jgi:endonuclease YncB( thermonuclease family)
VIATVYVRRGIFRKDVGLEMLRVGLATVYEAKSGAEYGGFEQKYILAEEKAKKQKIGMWAKPGLISRLMGERRAQESPREYKTRIGAQKKT